MVIISSAPLDIIALHTEFLSGIEDTGAVVTFLGLVREDGEEGVRSLFLDHLPGLTSRAVDEAVADAIDRWKLKKALVAHRVGEVFTGEAIVFAATAATHRRAAFEACDFLMDFLKTEAPFWKKQNGRSGGEWIEPRAEDYSDRDRWR